MMKKCSYICLGLLVFALSIVTVEAKRGGSSRSSSSSSQSSTSSSRSKVSLSKKSSAAPASSTRSLSAFSNAAKTQQAKKAWQDYQRPQSAPPSPSLAKPTVINGSQPIASQPAPPISAPTPQQTSHAADLIEAAKVLSRHLPAQTRVNHYQPSAVAPVVVINNVSLSAPHANSGGSWKVIMMILGLGLFIWLLIHWIMKSKRKARITHYRL